MATNFPDPLLAQAQMTMSALQRFTKLNPLKFVRFCSQRKRPYFTTFPTSAYTSLIVS